ncbi:hypothetical protein FRC08_018609, partial [Ceratobasidium sp. 394]
MSYSDCFVGGYRFTLEELSRIAYIRFKHTFDKPGSMEGNMLGEMEFELNRDIIRLVPDPDGSHRYIVISKWNETGEGFPFGQSQRDLALQQVAKRGFDLDCEWVSVRYPAVKD